MSNPPLSTVIYAILTHTPTYVWGILAALIVFGSLQLRDTVVNRVRLAIAPIALGMYSLWGATHAFGLRAEVVVAWAIGMAAVIGVNQRLQWPSAVRYLGAGRFALPGSAWPLIAMLSVFSLRYTVAVSLAFHPNLTHDALFGFALALVYGAISGFFSARVLRILGAAKSPSGLAAV